MTTELDWWGIKVVALSDEELAELCVKIGDDTDYDNYGWHGKRGTMRSLLAELRHHRSHSPAAPICDKVDWVLMPVNPTAAMLAAGVACKNADGRVSVASAYAAMLTALPGGKR